LRGAFEHTRGFAMTFTRVGRLQLLERFVFLAPFVDRFLVVDDGEGPYESVPNAFYLNLLMVPCGAAVGAHIDATLRDLCGSESALPVRVSVIYLQVPRSMTGGKLRLTRGSDLIGEVAPQEGDLVHFRGDLTHEVTPVQATDEGACRISLVCEQYHLEKEALAMLPDFRIQSKAGFAAYLKDHRHRPSTVMLDPD